MQQQGIEPPTFQKADRHPKAVTYYSCYMPGSWKCRIERFPRINVSNKQLCGYSVTLASEGTTTVLCKSLEPLISLFCFEGDTFLLFLCFLLWSCFFKWSWVTVLRVSQRWSLDWWSFDYGLWTLPAFPLRGFYVKTLDLFKHLTKGMNQHCVYT